MSTSDQFPLTRKQLREAGLTGSTPVVTPEQAESARHQDDVGSPDPRRDAKPLTRREIREQEQIRTGALRISDEAGPGEPAAADPAPERPTSSTARDGVVTSSSSPRERGQNTPSPRTLAGSRPDSEKPRAAERTDSSGEGFPTRRRSFEPAGAGLGTERLFPETPAPSGSATSGLAPSGVQESADARGSRADQKAVDEQDGVDDVTQDVAPVSVSSVMRAEEQSGRAWHAAAAPAVHGSEGAVSDSAAPAEPGASDAAATVADADAARGDADADSTVNPGFGKRVLAQRPGSAPARSFDAIIDESGGSQHSAPNALIFQQAPELSLSGPVASTGEILVTGSYELPSGLGSQGHADGLADGKEVDAVLVDGELAASSSPTPIAASAAIGTIKPSGEVIRPPEPEKGNKLMLTLTITAGALALALVAALIFAVSSGVFS